MSEQERRELDKALTKEITTPTPYLHPDGPQRGRNFLFLTDLERAEIIRRLDEVRLQVLRDRRFQA